MMGIGLISDLSYILSAFPKVGKDISILRKEEYNLLNVLKNGQ